MQCTFQPGQITCELAVTILFVTYFTVTAVALGKYVEVINIAY